MSGFSKEDYGLFLIGKRGPWKVDERRQELRAVRRAESSHSAAWISLHPFCHWKPGTDVQDELTCC